MDSLTFPFHSPYPVWQEIPDADLTHFSDYYLPGQGLHQPFLEYQRRIVRSVCIDIASQQPAPGIPPPRVLSKRIPSDRKATFKDSLFSQREKYSQQQ